MKYKTADIEQLLITLQGYADLEIKLPAWVQLHTNVNIPDITVAAKRTLDSWYSQYGHCPHCKNPAPHIPKLGSFVCKKCSKCWNR